MGEHQKSEIIGETSWERMINKLEQIFEDDDIDVDEVMDVLSSYKSDIKDWKKYAKFDRFKYTRNLIHEGNGKYNIMLLCWAEGNQSTIHDHADAHCFVKVLDGSLREVRFDWPEDHLQPDGSMSEKSRIDCKLNDVSYMSDELGLHRVENPSHSSRAVSMHVYIPAFGSCQCFDERTGIPIRCPMTFYSKFGTKVNRRRVAHKTSFEEATEELEKVTLDNKLTVTAE